MRPFFVLTIRAEIGLPGSLGWPVHSDCGCRTTPDLDVGAFVQPAPCSALLDVTWFTSALPCSPPALGLSSFGPSMSALPASGSFAGGPTSA